MPGVMYNGEDSANPFFSADVLLNPAQHVEWMQSLVRTLEQDKTSFEADLETTENIEMREILPKEIERTEKKMYNIQQVIDAVS